MMLTNLMSLNEGDMEGIYIHVLRVYIGLLSRYIEAVNLCRAIYPGAAVSAEGGRSPCKWGIA